MSQVPPNPSNYYRTPFGGGQPTPGPGNVSIDAISTAWQMITGDLTTFVVAALVVVLISAALSLAVSPISALLMYGTPTMPKPVPGQYFPPDYWTRQFIAVPINILVSAFHFCLNAGLMEIALRKQEGQTVSVGDLFAPFSRFGSLYGAGLVYSMIVTIGSYLCCIPGLIAMALLAFTPIMVYRQNLGPFAGIASSVQTLSKDVWMMTAVVFLAILASVVGACACCVGVIFTAPIYAVTVAVIYFSFFPAQSQWYSAAQPNMPPPPTFTP